jgi:RNA polymerase sigma-54 factor
LLELERRIVSDYHETLVRGNADSLPQKLEVSEAAVKLAVDGIRRLNPRPCMSLSESDSERSQTVVPDFVIETDGEGGISLSLNNGYVPSLKIDEEFLQEYDANLAKIGEMNKREREAFAYRKQKVESARMFIEAIRQRRRTLYTTMKAIIALQRDFFLTQDEAALRPMVLRDVAERTGLDESTVSRVKSSKYALVDGSVYPLDFFFMRTRANADGVVVVGRQVEKALMEIIDSEDKSAPYSDEQLVERLREKGMELKHRTVTKYRNKLGVPVAKNRRKI